MMVNWELVGSVAQDFAGAVKAAPMRVDKPEMEVSGC